jgi:signal transduction histidine kinase
MPWARVAAYPARVTEVWGDGDRPARRQLAFDVAAGLLFAALMGALHAQLAATAGLAAVLLGLALVVRRLSWPVMAALAVAAAVLQVATTEVAYLADGAYAVLFFTLGAHPASRVRRGGLACSLVATLVAGVFAATQPGATERTTLATAVVAAGLAAMTAVVTGGGWVAGFVRWQNRQAVQARVDAHLEAAERRRLSELNAVEQERRRIAADMHDLVAHSWAVVAAQSDGARYALPRDPAAAERSLAVIGETARTAMTDVRAIVAQLRDPALAPSTPGTAQQEEVVSRMRASGMDLRLVERGRRDESPLLALTAHRLLSESLTNALKHGDLAAPVHVEQVWGDGYRLTVTNDVPEAGVGVREPTHSPVGAHGLVGMAERTTVAGGTFSAGREGRQWVLRARLPGPTTRPAGSPS